MPNAIKYNVSAETLALKKGNFWIGTRGVNIGAGGVNLAIAGRYESYYHSKSVIGLFSIYDTSLSNNDIIKYYNATKGRFGL
jgi:hypothetical protein